MYEFGLVQYKNDKLVKSYGVIPSKYNGIYSDLKKIKEDSKDDPYVQCLHDKYKTYICFINTSAFGDKISDIRHDLINYLNFVFSKCSIAEYLNSNEYDQQALSDIRDHLENVVKKLNNLDHNLTIE